MPGAHAPERVRGIDLARCLALVGMMTAHVLRGVEDGSVTVTHQIVSGRSSALFAVLAGTGIVLVSGTRAPLRGREWSAEQAATWGRALVLATIGLLLGVLDGGLAVILTYYAVLFVLAAPLLALRTRWIAVAAAVVALLGPALSRLVRASLAPGLPGDPSPSALAHPVALTQDLLLTGNYPAATWLPYVLVGMVLGRLDPRTPAVALRVAVGGLAAVLVAWLVSDALVGLPGVRATLAATAEGRGSRGGIDVVLARGLSGVVPTDSWTWLLVRAPHSGAWFDLLTTTGSACAVIGVCVLVGRHLPARWIPLTGAGVMTLSLYSLHVVLRSSGLGDGDGWGHLAGHVCLVLVIGAVAARLGRRGPLELLASRTAHAARRLVVGPVRTSGTVPAPRSVRRSDAAGDPVRTP